MKKRMKFLGSAVVSSALLAQLILPTGVFADQAAVKPVAPVAQEKGGEPQPPPSPLQCKPSVLLTPGQTEQMKVLLQVPGEPEPADITADCQFSIDKENVATVDEAGLVTAVAAGAATLEITYEDENGEELSRKVPVAVVKEISVDKLTIDPASIDVPVEGQAPLHVLAQVKGVKQKADVTDKAEVTISDPAIATVEEGVIHALAEGSVTVTATFGGKTATAKVNVLPQVESLVVTPDEVKVTAGDKPVTLNVVAQFTNGTSQDVSKLAMAESADPEVAVVEKAGNKPISVKGMHEGETEVIVHFSGVDATVPVIVAKKPQKPKKLVVDQKSVKLAVEETADVVVTATFPDGSEEDVTADVQWQVKPDTVASIDGGTITGLAKGKATITGTFAGKSVKITVTVTE